MPNLFEATTDDAYSVKVLIETLLNSIKTAHIAIDDAGIHMCTMDTHRTVLFSVLLRAADFKKFYIDESHIGRKIYIGINMNHLYTVMKHVKKKEIMSLFIEMDQSPPKLGIRVINKQASRTTTSHIIIQNVQELEIEVPEITADGIPIRSVDFQKTVKDMSVIGSSLVISANSTGLKFASNKSGIIQRVVDFAVTNKNDTEYSEEFTTEQILNVSKITGLGAEMRIYPDTPIRIWSTVGNIGEVDLYIKTMAEINSEKQ